MVDGSRFFLCTPLDHVRSTKGMTATVSIEKHNMRKISAAGHCHIPLSHYGVFICSLRVLQRCNGSTDSGIADDCAFATMDSRFSRESLRTTTSAKYSFQYWHIRRICETLGMALQTFRMVCKISRFGSLPFILFIDQPFIWFACKKKIGCCYISIVPCGP